MPFSKTFAYLSGLLAAVAFAACASQKEAAKSVALSPAATPVGIATNLFDPKGHRLDSLVAVSNGDYIHIEIGKCFGRCDGYVSIFRESPAKFHIYEGEAWGYNEFDRSDVLFRLRKPITSDLAESLFAKARAIGIMKLVNDTTYAATDQPYIWVRARIGTETLAINRAYLGGKSYMGTGLGDIYVELRKLLLSLLYGGTPAVSDGK